MAVEAAGAVGRVRDLLTRLDAFARGLKTGRNCTGISDTGEIVKPSSHPRAVSERVRPALARQSLYTCGRVYWPRYARSTFRGRSLYSSTIVELTGEAASDRAGWAVGPAGDVDADGFADFLVGAPGNDDAYSGAGAAYLIFGTGL